MHTGICKLRKYFQFQNLYFTAVPGHTYIPGEVCCQECMAENTDVRSAGLNSVRCFEGNLNKLSRVQPNSLDFTFL